MGYAPRFWRGFASDPFWKCAPDLRLPRRNGFGYDGWCAIAAAFPRPLLATLRALNGVGPEAMGSLRAGSAGPALDLAGRELAAGLAAPLLSWSASCLTQLDLR